jgi:hypothetical protein
MTQEWFSHRCIAFVIVIALHCLVLLLLILEPIIVRVAEDDSSSVLFFIEAETNSCVGTARPIPARATDSERDRRAERT